ncbi:MAG: hypothetical protein ABIK92_13650 [Pseudomonadota bacterium]
MIVVTGIGWLDDKEYGYTIGKHKKSYKGFDSLYACFKNESIFSYPVKNFKRFDIISKNTCFSVALALKDAGIIYSYDQKHADKSDIGVLGTNEQGCLESNINYYKDYIESGRILARGNLFIYTLPSTPMAEAAIHFGLSGPLLHMSFSDRKFSSMLYFAKKSITDKETPTMIAVKAEESCAIAFVLEKEDNVLNKKNLNFENVVTASEKAVFDEMVSALTDLNCFS